MFNFSEEKVSNYGKIILIARIFLKKLGIFQNAIKVVNKYNRYLINGDSNSIKKNLPLI